MTMNIPKRPITQDTKAELPDNIHLSGAGDIDAAFADMFDAIVSGRANLGVWEGFQKLEKHRPYLSCFFDYYAYEATQLLEPPVHKLDRHALGASLAECYAGFGAALGSKDDIAPLQDELTSFFNEIVAAIRTRAKPAEFFLRKATLFEERTDLHPDIMSSDQAGPRILGFIRGEGVMALDDNDIDWARIRQPFKDEIPPLTTDTPVFWQAPAGSLVLMGNDRFGAGPLYHSGPARTQGSPFGRDGNRLYLFCDTIIKPG